jgi:uncharacterized protein (TIGR02147 family)
VSDASHWNLLDCTDWRSLVRRRLEALELPRGALAERVGQPEGWTARVLRGHRALAPDLVGPLARALRLDPEAERHFSALVGLDDLSPRSRRRAFAAVQQTQRARASPDLQEERYVAGTRWYVGAIAALADCDGFRMDPAWVGAVLVPPLGEDDAQEALLVLLRLGVLGVDEAGDVVADRRLLDEAGRRSGAVQASLLSHALEALHTADADRHTGGIDVALSEAHHAAVVERVRAFEQELVALAARDPGPRTRVYRVQLQAFPLSLATDAEPPALPAPLEDEPTGPDLNPDTVI